MGQRLLAGLTITACLAAGCDGQVKLPLVGDVKQAVSDTVEVARQTASLAGNVELQLDQPVKTSGCYARIALLSGGRPNVLQVTSYASSTAESFPSFCFRGTMTQRTAAELPGQEVAGMVFVQSSPEGPVWQSPADQPARFKVSTADDSSLAGELQGVLVNLATGETKPFQGTLSGELRSGR